MNNYLEKWACRSEEGPWRDYIIISDMEPRYEMGHFTWDTKNQQMFVVGINDTDLSLQKGTKQKVKMFLIPCE